MIRPILYSLPLIFLLLLLTIPPTASFTDKKAPQISYIQYCNDFVPETSFSAIPLTDSKKLSLYNAHYSFANASDSGTSSPGNHRSSSLSLHTKKVYKTQNRYVFKLDGLVSLRGLRKLDHFGNSTRRGLRLVHYRPPKIPVDFLGNRRPFETFYLSGFWNSSSGKLCMVGGNEWSNSPYSVLKLDFPDSSTISTSLVNGTLEIFNSDGKPIDALSILGLNLRNYEYELIKSEVQNNAFGAFDHFSNVSLGLEGGQSVCGEIKKTLYFDLEYTADCKSVNCNFLGSGTQNFTFPDSVFFNEIECWESGEVRYLLGFHHEAYNGVKLAFEPDATLIAEGKWDGENRRLDMVGCQILGGDNKPVDCSVRIVLRRPTVFTLLQRSSIVGEMWSNKSLNESGYFGRVAFRSHERKVFDFSGVRYEYTQIKNVNRSCARKMTPKGKGGRYPDATSLDMSFDMGLRNRKGEEVSGSCSPLFIGEKFNFKSEHTLSRGDLDSASQSNNTQSGLVNVSYELRFRPPPGLSLSINLPVFSSLKISAEGVYDSRSGHLCMIGCMTIDSPSNVKSGRPLDCEILVDVQYPPLDAKARSNVKGTIESTRNKTDRLYFEPYDIVSHHMYANQIRNSIWRMDLEITMVLISNTLACVFVCLQLFYVKKHPDVLPSISLVMLAVLTLAHMIPLVLNFEALFLPNHNRQNVHLGGGGWLEVNEVLVRVITMVVFLLEFRLLQLTWSAKVNDENRKILWVSEKKVLCLCIPLYLAGGLIVWFVSFLSSKPHGRVLWLVYHGIRRRPSFWGGLKSYAGLILDGFLFPQILFSLFGDTREKALVPSFYAGTTFVRLLPHAYDLYRNHGSPVQAVVKYIYANPRMDYYSTAWDIVICGGGLLLVFFVCLQQQFGGRCFLPKRFRQSSIYEKVPVVSA